MKTTTNVSTIITVHVYVKIEVRVQEKISFFLAQQPYWTRASSLSRLHDHIQKHQTLSDSSGQVTSPFEETSTLQHTTLTETHINAPRGIRTRNPSKKAAATHA